MSKHNKVQYCMEDDCNARLLNDCLKINGVSLNLCDKHAMEFIRKAKIVLNWSSK